MCTVVGALCTVNVLCTLPGDIAMSHVTCCQPGGGRGRDGSQGARPEVAEDGQPRVPRLAVHGQGELCSTARQDCMILGRDNTPKPCAITHAALRQPPSQCCIAFAACNARCPCRPRPACRTALPRAPDSLACAHAGGADGHAVHPLPQGRQPPPRRVRISGRHGTRRAGGPHNVDTSSDVSVPDVLPQKRRLPLLNMRSWHTRGWLPSDVHCRCDHA